MRFFPAPTASLPLLLLFLAFQAGPSEGLRCFACGKDALDEAQFLVFNTARRGLVNIRATDPSVVIWEPCGTGKGSEFICPPPNKKNLSPVCLVGVTDNGTIGRGCGFQSHSNGNCELGGGGKVCDCNKDLCNTGNGGGRGRGEVSWALSSGLMILILWVV